MDPNRLNPAQQPGYGDPRSGSTSPQGIYGPPQQGQQPPNSVWFPSAGPLPYGAGMGMAGARLPPTQINWMQRPANTNCPPGLEYLTQIDQIIVKQVIEMFEMFTRIETENRYICMNTLGQTFYYCREESEFFIRNNCGSQRPFVMHIQDNNGMEVIRLNRPYRYKCCHECCSCCECCQDEVEVQAPVGHTIGYVRQSLDKCSASFNILDSHKKKILRIHGPNFCTCECYGRDINFHVMSRDGSTKIGTVSKQWTNLIQEYFTDADNFGITFPMDLDVKIKAILIAAVMLIDYMYFERGRSVRRY